MRHATGSGILPVGRSCRRQAQLAGDVAPFLRQAPEPVGQVLAEFGGVPPRRRIRLAFSDHAVGPALPGILRHIRALLPGIVPEVVVGLSTAMRERFAAGEVDAAIVRQDVARAEEHELYEDALLWAAAAEFEADAGGPVPLVVLDGPCGVKSAAIRVLEAKGLPWRIAFLGGSVTALLAAMQAGLGVAPIGVSHLPDGCVPFGGLPALPRDRIVLQTRLEDPTRRMLISAARAAHASRTRPPP